MPSPAVSRIGRPRQFDVDELVATTLQLFWSNGYRNTSTRDLEGALGVTQSSLYHAFGSKAGLLDAVLDGYQEAVDTSLLEPLRNAPDGSTGLATFLRDLGTWMAADGRGCLMVNLMVDEAPTNPAIATRTTAHRERLRAALRVAVEKVSGSAETKTVDRRTDLLLAATLGLNLAARAGASATELARIISGVDAEVASWSTP
jgi:AcrR family transcriptional regulator